MARVLYIHHRIEWHDGDPKLRDLGHASHQLIGSMLSEESRETFQSRYTLSPCMSTIQLTPEQSVAE
jgi:hypothetical protein